MRPLLETLDFLLKCCWSTQLSSSFDFNSRHHSRIQPQRTLPPLPSQHLHHQAPLPLGTSKCSNIIHSHLHPLDHQHMHRCILDLFLCMPIHLPIRVRGWRLRILRSRRCMGSHLWFLPNPDRPTSFLLEELYRKWLLRRQQRLQLLLMAMFIPRLLCTSVSLR